MARGRLWTEREEKWLILVWGKKPKEEIAKALRRTENAVYQRASELGLMRPGAAKEPDWVLMREMLDELAKA